MEHTPGPWKVDFGRIIDTEKFDTVAVCGGTSWGADVIDANARLIAAAPEMLKALKAVTKVIIESGWCHCGARVAAPLGPHATDCAHEQARAAIKAAKGDA